MKIEVWSDYVCPFCYIGKRRLEMAIEQFPHQDQVEVEFKSFQLDPNTAKYTEQSIYEALAAKFGTSEAQVREMNKGMIAQAAEIGLTYNYDNMKPTNTFDAHRLAKFAKTVGKEKDLTENLLHGYFTESKNVGDLETLADIAEASGIDRAQALEILNDEKAFAVDVNNDQIIAQQFRITGVPFFIINQKYAISGAQPLETFTNALEKVWEEENPKPLFEDLSQDTGAVCTDESCIIPTKE
ncbi:DsbA family oxidoreductase [Robertmurraya yapensis]|uniref:DsbA family oxidoreductase n=1 Tax=Bacillus yapensis TaxID=2492960 RepID=A0A3S0KJ29_9BACI|nr:DsbA family oxidoreductase [Bacillus yapensis]RTR27848.1 DsbA family oxidoreductase [Bacillus yapensis]TKS94251.1 DsbA family oxidoreductase [Bacillus yapensis]